MVAPQTIATRPAPPPIRALDAEVSPRTILTRALDAESHPQTIVTHIAPYFRDGAGLTVIQIGL